MMKNMLFSTIILLMLGSCAEEQKETANFDPSFVHVVYFWLKDPNNIEDRKALEASLKKFMLNSKYAQTKFVGVPPKASRDVVDDSFAYNLVLTFGSAEEQELYQNEEAHLLFIEESQDLWERVVVYDALVLE
ncbi:Dabb family protein [uncultured Muriicola sp.]|uniref:Dabb family protein n=1 Tax=uncultured Muriicola sp. TaxID=1583102 RepID=UPI00345C57E0